MNFERVSVAALAAAVSLCAVAASAGDLSSVAAQPALIMPAPAGPASPFDGFWAGVSLGKGFNTLGVNAGLRQADTTVDVLSLSYPDSGATGALVGVEAGYSRSFGSNWSWGAQLDHSVADLDANANFRIAVTDGVNSASGDFGYKASIKSMTSALGRIGYTVNPTSMLYGLAGVTAAKATASLEGINPTNSVSDFDIAGLTVGLGVETMISDKTSIKLEYRATDFGKSEFDNIDSTISDVPVNFHASVSSRTDSIRAVLVHRF